MCTGRGMDPGLGTQKSPPPLRSFPSRIHAHVGGAETQTASLTTGHDDQAFHRGMDLQKTGDQGNAVDTVGHQQYALRAVTIMEMGQPFGILGTQADQGPGRLFARVGNRFQLDRRQQGSRENQTD